MPQPGSTPTADHPASIPTRHQPLEESRVGDFGCWIDGELAKLETEHADFCTRSSLKKHLGR